MDSWGIKRQAFYTHTCPPLFHTYPQSQRHESSADRWAVLLAIMTSFFKGFKRRSTKRTRQGGLAWMPDRYPFGSLVRVHGLHGQQTTVTGFKARTRASAQGINPTPERPTLRPDYRSEATHERSELTSIDKVDSLSR